MKLIKQIKDDPQLRDSFNGLAMKTFGLSFSEWWRRGYWTDSYIPYVFVDGGKVVANASVNLMDLMWHGQPKRYIQIGTVMTDAAYRHQGLSRTLLQEIIGDWADKSDALYLFANDTVLDFYPKFGFQRGNTSTARPPTATRNGRKLDMETEADRQILLRHFQMSMPIPNFP
ncbi:MAG: GNAT family N-acetyltransferase [Bianqueaceae bacterium]